jgi:hypothetical protein
LPEEPHFTARDFAELSRQAKLKQPWVHITGLQLEKELRLIYKRRFSTLTTVMASHWDPGTMAQPVFVLLDGEELPKSVTGRITGVSDNIRGRMRTPGNDIQRLQHMIEAEIVDTRPTQIYVLPGVVATACLGILSFGLLQWRKATRLLHSSTSPPLRALLRFGPFSEVIPVINTDLGSGSAKHIGPVRLGPDFLMVRDKSDFHVIQISRMVWAYVKITQRRYKGIPAGQTYRLMMGDEFGYLVGAKMAKVRAGELLEILKKCQPILFLFFSDDLARAWMRNPIGTAAAIRNRERANELACNSSL